MKLIPPVKQAASVESQRPALNTLLSVVNPDNPDEEWTTTLRIRLEGHDMATRPTDAPASPLETMIVLRQAGTVWEFPVSLEPLDGPIASWRVFYRDAPRAVDIRREWRNAEDTFGGFVRRADDAADQRMPSISYDFSLSAVRFFTPWRVAVGDRIFVRWHLESEWVEGTMRIVRADSSVVWWRKQQGFTAVGQWDTLSPDMEHVWRSFCWRHQPDAIAALTMSS